MFSVRLSFDPAAGYARIVYVNEQRCCGHVMMMTMTMMGKLKGHSCMPVLTALRRAEWLGKYAANGRK